MMLQQLDSLWINIKLDTFLTLHIKINLNGCKKINHTGPGKKPMWILLWPGRKECVSMIENPESIQAT